MTDVDHNVFNGEQITDAELRNNWRMFLFIMPLCIFWLAVEGAAFGAGWAAAAFPHVVLTWVCLCILTWWRLLGVLVLTFCIAALAGARAFVKSWREECSTYF